MIVACDDVVMDGAEVAVGVGEGVAVAILIGAGVGVGVGSATFREVKTSFAPGTGSTVTCAGPSTTTGLINSGGDAGSMIVAVSTAPGSGVGVAVGVGVGIAVAVGVGVAIGVAVGVAAAAITTPRVLPPSCVKL